MFDIGFSEVLLIFFIALIVLGPEKLPRLASQVGRWIGRARAMARQFREQLEEEVNLEEVRKAHAKPQKPASAGAPPDSASTDQSASAQGSSPNASTNTDGASPSAGAQDAQPPIPGTAAGTTPYHGPDPADFRADTFSHAHPTNEYGANPYTSTGSAEEPPPAPPPETPGAPEPSSAHVSPAQSQFPFDARTASEANVAAAQPQSAPQPEQRASSDEAYAARKSRDNTPGTDNHGN